LQYSHPNVFVALSKLQLDQAASSSKPGDAE